MMASSGSAVSVRNYPSSMRRTAPAAGSRIPLPQNQSRRDEARHVSAPHGQRSRLLIMQEEYQKKLLKEKEEKMVAIYNKQQEQTAQRLQKQDGRGQGIVRDFFRERKEMEQSGGSANLLSRDKHFQKKLLEKKKTSSLNNSSAALSQENLNRGSSGSDVEEQRRHEERKEHEMQNYKRQWQDTKAQSSPKRAEGVVRSKPLAPIKRGTGKGRGQNVDAPPTFNHYETSDNLSYDGDEDDYALPPSKPQKVSHRALNKTFDSPQNRKKIFQKEAQPEKLLNPKKVAPPIARKKPNEIKVKKEKMSDFQKWQQEQDLARKERLSKYEEKQASQKEHYSVDYDKELEADMKSAKTRRKMEYDEMLAKERELEKLIAKHKGDLAQMSHDKSDDEDEVELPPQKHIKPSKNGKVKVTSKPKHVNQFDEDMSPPSYRRPMEDDYESRAGEFRSRQKHAPAKPKPKRSVPSREPDPEPPYQPPAPVSYDTSFYEQADDGDVADVNLVSCPVCGRRFAAERLAKHSSICKKASKKTRKVFDSTKHRTEGTEIAQYVKRGEHLKSDSAAKPSNWKRKHEDFIRSIRDARQTQAYLAKGGKLSDLPPPPLSENPDYKKCPYCERRFNPTAADRHIPRCKDIKSRPKPLRKK